MLKINDMMKTLFHKFNDKPTSEKSNTSHLQYFKELTSNTDGEIITLTLKKAKAHWVKIRVATAVDFNPSQIPKGLRKKNPVCLYLILKSSVPLLVLLECKNHSKYFDWRPGRTVKTVVVVMLVGL